jgi:rubrerythrin
MTKTKGIDFAELSLRDALDLATLIEEEARDRYEEFGDQMELHNTPAAAKFFRYMEGNEEKHRTALAKRRSELFGDAPRVVTRRMIFDVEAPDYDEVYAFMSPREALESAMRSETKAREFFENSLAGIKDPEVRALFEELRDEEIEHQKLVQAELDKLPEGHDFPEDAFADDPVAH